MGREFSLHVQEAVRRIPFRFSSVPFAQRVLDLRPLLKRNAGLGQLTSDSGSRDFQALRNLGNFEARTIK